jgi:23S rRNA pseudouridine1911/1915/1917 synthase
VTEKDVLYCDNHVLVVNKPAGLSTQCSDMHPQSLEEQAREWLKVKYNKPGNVFLHTVHRLDRPVSGAVLFARTDKALSRLNAYMREKQHEKIYLAAIEGKMPSHEGILAHYHTHERFKALVTLKPRPDAKKCMLKYSLAAVSGGFSLLEIKLETGRYHQIRAQLAEAGRPILGDTKYGSGRKFPGEAIALHHHGLTFVHPVSKEEIPVTAPLPETKIWEIFRNFA